MKRPTDGTPAEAPEETEDMSIATAATGIPQSEQDLWSAVRSYLNLQVPLAAVLRRPYAFLRPGEQPAGRPDSTVLPFRKPAATSTTPTEDQESP